MNLAGIAYHAGIDSQPALILVLFDHLLEQLLVVRVAHLLMDPALVTGHVVRDDGKAQGERGVHPVHVYVHCIRGLDCVLLPL